MAKKKRTRAERQPRDLATQVAKPGVVSVRQAWEDSAVAASLGPRALADLVQSVRTGTDYGDYLSLAEEMEERDLYYRSLIATRKLAVQAVEPTISPAGDDQAAVDLAAAVRRDIVDRPEFVPMVYDLLDAISKGYSAVEIVWDTRSVPWRPTEYFWRDPKWLRFDRATGRELRLLTDHAPVDGVPLERHKWVVHVPQLKSGLPLRAGLALPVAYYHLIKSYDVSAWIAFIETFGYPLRVGKYSKNATTEDVAVLKRAVANVGRDVGAVIPDDMVLDIVAGVQQGSSVDYYEKLSAWCDRQQAVGVLGQVATTEGTPGRLGSDDTQSEVRHDILRSDARQLAATLQRDLVQPYVDLNHGQQPAYPRLQIIAEPPEDIALLVDSVARLAPLGLPVATKDLRRRLRLTEPGEDDEVLSPPPPPPPAPGPQAMAASLQLQALAAAALARRTATTGLQARGAGDADVEDDLAALVADQDWEPITRPIYEAVQTWAEGIASLEEAQRRLPELLATLDGERMIERLADDLLRARGLGDIHFADRDEPTTADG